MDEGGIIMNTGYEKMSGRLNVDHRLNDKTKLSVSTNLIRSESDRGVTGNDNTTMTYGFVIGGTQVLLILENLMVLFLLTLLRHLTLWRLLTIL